MNPRYTRPYSTKKPASAGKRVMVILAVGAVAAAFIAMFNDTERHGVTPPPEPQRLDRLSHRNLSTQVTDNGIIGGALAAEKKLALMNDEQNVVPADANRTVKVSVAVRTTPPRPPMPVVSRATPIVRLPAIRSRTPQATPELAKEEIYVEAQKQLATKLQTLDEPVRHVPSLAKVRELYAQPSTMKVIQPTAEDQKLWAEANLDPNRIWVEMDVEVSAEQLRNLRAEDRLWTGSHYFAAAFILVGALFGFFRLDGLTRGYLTWALGAGIVAVVVGLLAGMRFVG